MKRLFIIIIAADIILTTIFLPWGMLVNVGILVVSLMILIPVFYYRLYVRGKK
jgi:hypothetical protein